ncbi:hypothetical protein BKA82DRAFT_144439, partial [Pisolithus tinctorius]
SQHFNRGNVALLPQDPSTLSNVLPPTLRDLCGAVCVVFAGGSFRPSMDALQRFPLVLVSKSRVKCIIEWLMSNNEWYMKNGISFSPENLASLSHIPMVIALSGPTMLAHALNHKSFLVSHTGSELMNENSPGFLSAVFPHLDPWGISGFNHPACRPDQHISFQ